VNFDVADLEPQQKYRLLNGGVTPRPIAWVSTTSKNGVDNLAPYSFFTVASCNPPVLLYTQVTQRNGIDKDTLQNLRETGECVVNIVNADMLEKMNMTSAALHVDESEFDYAQVEQSSSCKVAPFSVRQAPVRYECTLREIMLLSELPAGGSVVLLDVKSIYVQDELYDDGLINQNLINSVGRMGGDAYSFTSSLEELKRP